MYHNNDIFVECGIEKTVDVSINTIKLIYDLKWEKERKYNESHFKRHSIRITEEIQ